MKWSEGTFPQQPCEGMVDVMLAKAVGVAIAALAWQGWRWYCRRAHQGLEAEQAAEEEAQPTVRRRQHAHAASRSPLKLAEDQAGAFMHRLRVISERPLLDLEGRSNRGHVWVISSAMHALPRLLRLLKTHSRPVLTKERLLSY